MSRVLLTCTGLCVCMPVYFTPDKCLLVLGPGDWAGRALFPPPHLQICRKSYELDNLLSGARHGLQFFVSRPDPDVLLFRRALGGESEAMRAGVEEVRAGSCFPSHQVLRDTWAWAVASQQLLRSSGYTAFAPWPTWCLNRVAKIFSGPNSLVCPVVCGMVWEGGGGG